MTKWEYFVRNAFVIVFMAFLWMMTMPVYSFGQFIAPLLIAAAGVGTLFLGEVLWGEVVYKQLYPLKRR